MRHRLAAHALAPAIGFSDLISCLSLKARTTTLSGTVLGPTGAVVPNAAVELIPNGTRLTKHSASDGIAPHNLLRGPRYSNVGLSGQKSFALRERSRLQLRGDFFNLFNNVHLNAPGANLNAPSAIGKIISAGETRIIQLALRVEF